MRQPLDCLDGRSLPGMSERRYRELVAKFGGVANSQTQPLIADCDALTVVGMSNEGSLPRTKQDQRALSASRGALQFGISDSPYLTVDEAARFCRFDATAPQSIAKSFRAWLHRQAVPIIRRGRVLLIEKRVLEAALRDGGMR
jgi:hypothetical protein